MAICALGYIGIRSDRLEDWCRFSEKILGMQKIDRGGNAFAFRMDDYRQRFVVSNDPGDTLAFIGWEVKSKSDLQKYAAPLDKANIKVTQGSRELIGRRFVEDLIFFNDPGGNRIELFYGPMLTSEPFIPGRPIDRFNTGPLGMGHAVLHVEDVSLMLPFYQDLLEFKVSDFGLKPYPMYFFHVNGRHHSFAVIGSGKCGFHHFMIEYTNIDNVGQGYDLAQLRDNGIAYTLGRHTNDHMFSYYATSPSGFFVENGWGGRVIDPETWVPHETFCGPSFWGHERLYLTEEGGRKRFREMRMEEAEKGRRAPPILECPWLYGELIAQKR